MANAVENRIVTGAFVRTTRWLGRSGRSYELVGENLDTFSMDDSALYLIAKGNHVLWVGSTGELVNDPLSRARFRLAMDCADRIFRLQQAGAEAERLSVISDLETGEPLPTAVAA